MSNVLTFKKIVKVNFGLVLEIPKDNFLKFKCQWYLRVGLNSMVGVFQVMITTWVIDLEFLAILMDLPIIDYVGHCQKY